MSGSRTDNTPGNAPGTIRCDIVAANRQLFSGEVTRCVVSGTGGELGIYPRHAPLMTTLKAGEVRVRTPDDEELTFIIGGGILEVMPHLVTVLADTAVRADDIDETAALQAKAEAERELQTREERMDIAEAQAKLAEAVAQLRALERLRRKIKRK
jgi:F-type H+-transporting ATPase subunit epsilon